MSKLRITKPAPDKRVPDRFDSLWMIRDSVERQHGLIYGELHDGKGAHCAIGSFFADNPNLALNLDLIDEVAAYNDSIPKSMSSRLRRNKVLRWLTAKIDALRPVIPLRRKPKKKAA